MAQITGSSTINWSDISLAQIDFETDIVTFTNRVDEIFTDLGITPPGNTVSRSPTLFVVDLVSGGRLTLGGSGFDGTSPLIINSFNFKNPPDGTGEVIKWAGTLDGIGKEFFTSATIGSTGFSETIKGNIIIPATFPTSGNITATLTSLVVKIGSAKGTFSGNFSMTGDLVSASLTGTVTGISVVSGTNTIKMTGLSLSLDVVEAALVSGDLANVNDLFSFVGNQLNGNDTITYTNNIPGTGMTFFGGGGDDTITVIGANADTLVGGTGNDTYVHIAGGLSDSFVENTGEGSDTIRAAVTFTLPDASQNIENLTLTGPGNIDGTGNATGNVLTGNSGNNVLSGGDGDDTLNGGVGADTLQGEAGDDLVLLASTAQFALGEVINGGPDTDTLRFTSVVAGTLTLNTNVIDVERVELANAAGLSTGLAAINVNAAAVTSNGMTLVGNNGANVLTGTTQADTLTGNGGNDRLNGGLGDDTLDGGLGNDRLIGGAGEDSQQGGEGNDVFLFAVGDSGAGESVVGGAGTDALRFTATSGTLDLSGSVDVENVAIATAAGATTGTTAVDLNATDVTNALSIIGNNGANQITGTAFADTLTGNLGIDQLLGGDGNDTLNGGAGADTLQGEAGDDLVLLASTAQFALGEVINGGPDTDTLRFTSVVAGTLTLSANVIDVEQVEIANATGLTTGLAAINVNAAAVTSNGLTLVGNNGANVLTGTNQADTLTGNGSNDTLRGGLGDDTYQVDRGDGRDRISENDGTGGNSDSLLYGATINPLDLVLSRQVNDLRIALHGTTERVTIQNWYANPTTAQVETIQAGNGDTLLNTQVQQLIDAMAQFTTDTGLSWDAASGGAGDSGQQAQFQGIIAANWQ